MKRIKAAVIGGGSRGLDGYALYAEDYPHELEITAVAEPRRERRDAYARRFSLSDEHVFNDWEALMAAPELADMVFICTQDTMHVEPAVAAMGKRYHILPEKPVAVSREGCMTLHNENVGHIHYSHSYVRGNWRNRAEASPIIMAKSFMTSFRTGAL